MFLSRAAREIKSMLNRWRVSEQLQELEERSAANRKREEESKREAARYRIELQQFEQTIRAYEADLMRRASRG